MGVRYGEGLEPHTEVVSVALTQARWAEGRWPYATSTAGVPALINRYPRVFRSRRRGMTSQIIEDRKLRRWRLRARLWVWFVGASVAVPASLTLVAWAWRIAISSVFGGAP